MESKIIKIKEEPIDVEATSLATIEQTIPGPSMVITAGKCSVKEEPLPINFAKTAKSPPKTRRMSLRQKKSKLLKSPKMGPGFNSSLLSSEVVTHAILSSIDFPMACKNAGPNASVAEIIIATAALLDEDGKSAGNVPALALDEVTDETITKQEQHVKNLRRRLSNANSK